MLCAFSVQAELGVSLEPVEASRFVYEPFSLQLEITGGTAKLPTVPSGAGYSITGVFQGPDSGNILIEIIAEEPGILTVPPFAVSTSNETIQTPLLRLPISAPRRAREMDLSIRFSATRLVVDQPVRMDVVWTSKVPFTRSYELQLDLPLLRNPAWEVYALVPDVPEKQRIGLPVNAQRVIARNAQTEEGFELSFSYQMIPRTDGVYSSGARLSCALMESKRSSSQYPSYFDNHFFNRPDQRDRYEQVYLNLPQTELTVQALPEEGRTVRYSGIVGDCVAVSSVEPADTVVGQPMLLTVTLTNIAFGGHIRNLPEATLDGLGSEFRISPEPMHIETRPGAKAFTYIIRPLRSGITDIPALTLDRFDPETKTYVIIRTAPLQIQVAPDGDQTVYQPTQQKIPLIPHTGIRNNRTESRLQMNAYELLETTARNGWIIWLLPPTLYLLFLRRWLAHRDRCRIDPAYARAKRALRRFMKNALSNEEAAWNAYLADRLNLHAEAVTAVSVSKELKKLNVSDELIEAARDRFAHRDAKHYSPDKRVPGKASHVHALVRKIEKATRATVLLLCLLPVFDSDAFTPEQLFDQAMAIRTEKPDEAAPLFTEAALGFEAEEQYLNAGNSWFFAGENGRALANYRSAQNRRPYNKQIRESIDFIRTQRTSGFQGLEKSGTHFSKVWKRLCSYHPALRFGALTLMYLIGWGAWLTARVLGKTIKRKAWIIYGAHAAAIALSLIWSFFQPSEGVVIQAAEARLGPGYAYESAFDSILHEATEFQWLEKRDGWVHARMPDASEAWLRKTACIKIR